MLRGDGSVLCCVGFVMTLYFVIYTQDYLSSVVRGWLSSMLCGVCNDIIICDLHTGLFIQCCEGMAQFYVVWGL